MDKGISATGHGKGVVDLLNAINTAYIYQLMSNVQLPGSKQFYYHILIHTSTQNNDISLAKTFQQHLSKYHFSEMVALIRENTKKEPVK